MHDGNDACSLTYAWLSDGTPVSATLGEGNLPGRLYNGSFVFVTDSTRIDIAESVAWDEGRIFFLDTDTTDCWYAGDHLGNVRSVIDISKGQAVPQVLEQSDYLPYGTRINNTAFASMSGENRWRYAAKEEQRLSCLVTDPFAPDGGYNRSLDLGLLNFGARMYDPFTARWTALDPLAREYSNCSPFGFCVGNPENSFDVAGEKIIFVNGLTAFGSPSAGFFYWNPLANSKMDYSSFVKKAMQVLRDEKVAFPEISHRLTSTAESRRNQGYNYAKANLSSLVSDLEEGETIKFITHSMGAAFSEGMADYLLESGYRVEMMLHFEPYQASNISSIGTSANILTIDYQTSGDWVISFSGQGRIQGSDNTVLGEQGSSTWSTVHRKAIDTEKTWNEIIKFINAFLNEQYEQ